MARATERMDLLVAMFTEIKTEQREVRQRIDSLLSLVAGHSAQIAGLERADEEHDKAHGRHRAEHRSAMLKILLVVLGSVPAVVGAAWWLARKLP